jgi:alpha-1,3-rhamnosyltransferase
VLKALANSGISQNCNRGLYSSEGTWIKLIAGDDLLYPHAISEFVKFTSNKKCEVIFGRSHFLKNGNLTADCIPSVFTTDKNNQRKRILKGSGVASVGAFILRKTLLDAGGFNERYPMIEDAPLWIKLTTKGVYFHFLNNYVAKYRIHENNSSRASGTEVYIRVRFFREQEKIIKEIILPQLIKDGMWGAVLNSYNYIATNNLIIISGNKNTIFSKFIALFIFAHTFQKVKRRFKLFGL